MTAETIIQFLKIFGLIMFDTFFLVMIILGIYLFFVVANLRKLLNSLQNEIKKTVINFEEDTYLIANALKSKIESIDSKKIVWGSTLLGGVFGLISKGFFKKSKSKGIAKSIIDIFL